ncbi:proline-rich protein 23A [Ochotona princeps]|uniref:proline-rich protein 23A n=1 Tax=Ochotona princeps TaxID=9978 RepID=UPI002714F124|nr:proline-rich protein 23A [Ochotona princeps]
MPGIRHSSPSTCPAPGWHPQPGEPGTAKRRRLDVPAAGPQPLPQPGLSDPALVPAPEDYLCIEASVHYEAAADVSAHGLAPSSLSSVVVLPTGSALQLQHPELGVDLLLEPPPTAVLAVSLLGYTLLLVPQGLLDAAHPHSGAQGQAPGGDLGGLSGLQLDALLTAVEQLVVLGQQQWPCASVPQEPGQEDALQEAAPAASTASTASTASELLAPRPWAASPSSAFDDCHLLRPLLPSSSLWPLPPSPSPAPQQRPENPQRPPRPACKARRRLLFK